MKKRVLIITYYWPPSGGSGVQRWLKTSKYLPEFGWEPVIYTPLNPDVNSVDESLLKDVSPELEVIKRKIREPYAAYKFLSGKKKGEHLQANLIAAKKSFFSRLSMHIRANWFIPDPRCWWIKPSVKYLSKIIRQQTTSNECTANNNGVGFDAVISTGPPHSMHLIAKELHARYGIPWIADFRDPWTKIFYFKHLGLSEKSLRKHKALERSVLEEADRVVVVSEQMKAEFSTGEYDGFADKIYVIPNGYDPDDFSAEKNPELKTTQQEVTRIIERHCKASSPMETEGKKFVVAHTGLMPQSADPDRLWKVLGDMVKEDAKFKEKLLIAVMGQTDDCTKNEIAENGLSDNFTDLGYVPHSTSVAWMKRADLLLLPLRKEKESKAIVTGKFFEYLASGNRILAFGPTDGNLAEELRLTGSGNICEFDDEAGIKSCMQNIWKEYKDSSAGGKISTQNITAEQMARRQQFSREKGAENFAAMLDNIKPHGQ